MNDFAGTEDISFSMGLNGMSLVDNLDSTEKRVGTTLSKIGQHFKTLKKTVEDSGKSNKFRDDLESTTKTAQKLTKVLNDLQRAVQNVNAEFAKSKGAADSGLSKQLATLLKLQTAVTKLQSQMTGLGQRIQTAAAQSAGKLGEVTRRLDEMGNAGQRAGTKLKLSGQTLNQSFQQAGGILRNISTVLSTLGLGGGIFAVIYGFKQLVASGIELNSQIEQAKISLGAEVVGSAKLVELDGQRVEGLKAIQAVQGDVGKVVEKLKLDAIFVNGTFQDLLGIAQSITPVVVRLGGNLEQVHRLTQLTGIAASVLGVDFKEAATGLTQLLNGNFVGRNNFVKRLPGDVNELKASIKDSSKVIDVLIDRMSRLEAAGPLLARGFKGALDSVRDIIAQWSGTVFEPLKKRLQDAFNSVVSGKIIRLPDGTKQWSADVEATLGRVSHLVDTLLNQIVVLSQRLFQTSGRSFLDTAEELLPRVVEFMFSLLGIVKSVVDFMMNHGAAVAKVLGYYLSFKLAVGVFNSIKSSVLGIAGAFTTVKNLIADAIQVMKYLTGAVIETRTEYEAAEAKAAALGATLKAALAGTAVMLLIMALVELGRGLIQAHDDSENLRLSLNDINKVKFDGAIEQLRRLKESIKDTGFWNSIRSGHTTKGKLEEDINQLGSIPTASKQRLVAAATAMGLPLNGLTGDSQSADLAALVIKEAKKRKDDIDSAYASASADRKKELDSQTAALNDDIKAGEGMIRVLKDFGDAFDLAKEKVQWAATQGIDTSQMNLGNFYGFSVASRNVGRAEASLENRGRVTVTPSPSTTDDSAVERRLEENQARLMNALEQVAQAASRVAEKNAQTAVDRLDEQVKKHLLTVQEASAQEISIAQDTYAKKLKAQQTFFDKIDEKGLADLKGAKESLGLAGGGKLSFSELLGLSDKDLTGAIADLESEAATADKNKQAEFRKKVTDLQTLLKIWSAATQEQAKLQGTISQANERKAGAEEKSRDFIAEQNILLEERNAQLAVEEGQLNDATTALDDRLQRERELNRLLVSRQQTEVDRRTTKELAATNARTDITQPEKDRITSGLLTAADREKRYIAAKGEVDLARQLIEIRDQEIDLSQQGYQIKELELGTLKEILGAENPLVAQKAKELALDKAQNLEQKAQARLDAAEELRKKGQNTAAREAEKQADLLRAQAQQLRIETENYLQVLGTGLGQLSGLLGKFSGLLGSTTSGIGTLLGQVGKLSKIDIGGLYNAGKNGQSGLTGILNGALAVAGPIGAVASTAIGLFQGFFEMFNAGYKKLLDAAHDRIDKELNEALSDLRSGRQSLTQTIADLQGQYANVENKYPKAKSAPWWSWIMPVVGAAWTIGAGLSNDARQKAIDDDRLSIMRELEQLAKDAQETIWELENKTLPSLRVSPAMREFEDELTKIREELQKLAGTPGITQQDLNEMFNIRLADLAREINGQILDERQNYLDVLKQEKDLKQQLADLDQQEADIEADYKQKRMEILGYTSRELSKAEQLAKLEKDKQEQINAIEERRKELQAQLDYVEKQKSLYEEVFGVVQDIGEYETSIQDALLAKTKERLEALGTFFNELKSWMEGPMWNFITNNGQTTANGNPYALPVVLVDPGSLPISGPSVTINGDITVNGDMSPGDVRQAFIDAWTQVNQTNATRGLAFSNA